MSIKNVLVELLSENGIISTMRLMSLISLFIGSGIAIYGISHNKDLGGVAQICAVFVTAAFAGKTAQKYMENK